MSVTKRLETRAKQYRILKEAHEELTVLSGTLLAELTKCDEEGPYGTDNQFAVMELAEWMERHNIDYEDRWRQSAAHLVTTMNPTFDAMVKKADDGALLTRPIRLSVGEVHSLIALIAKQRIMDIDMEEIKPLKDVLDSLKEIRNDFES